MKQKIILLQSDLHLVLYCESNTICLTFSFTKNYIFNFAVSAQIFTANKLIFYPIFPLSSLILRRTRTSWISGRVWGPLKMTLFWYFPDSRYDMRTVTNCQKINDAISKSWRFGTVQIWSSTEFGLFWVL